MQRRQFVGNLTALVALGASTAAWSLRPGGGDRPGRPLKILVLGGRRFVGPAIVAEALARGHEVTLFNRGLTNPELFAHLELIRGDRTRDGGLVALEGTREWDAVVDTWSGDPQAVAATAKLLQARAGQYAYISSIAVYGGALFRRVGLPATVEVPSWKDADASEGDEMIYPARKAFAERFVQQFFPQTFTIHRAHGIRGLNPYGRLDHDEEVANVTPYWIARMHKGGRYLAPGKPSDTTQWIDVQDLAHFVVHGLEHSHTGPFNLCQTARWGDYLGVLDDLTGNHAEPVWVPAGFLFDRGIMSFTDAPGWVSHDEVEKGFYQVSNERALAHGLSMRPQADTYSEIYQAWLFHHYPRDDSDPTHSVKLGREEARLLEEWAVQSAHSGE